MKNFVEFYREAKRTKDSKMRIINVLVYVSILALIYISIFGIPMFTSSSSTKVSVGHKDVVGVILEDISVIEIDQRIYSDELCFSIRDSIFSTSDSIKLAELSYGYKTLQDYKKMTGLPKESIFDQRFLYEPQENYVLFGIGEFARFDKEIFIKNINSIMYRKKNSFILKVNLKSKK